MSQKHVLSQSNYDKNYIVAWSGFEPSTRYDVWRATDESLHLERSCA